MGHALSLLLIWESELTSQYLDSSQRHTSLKLIEPYNEWKYEFYYNKFVCRTFLVIVTCYPPFSLGMSKVYRMCCFSTLHDKYVLMAHVIRGMGEGRHRRSLPQESDWYPSFILAVRMEGVSSAGSYKEDGFSLRSIPEVVFWCKTHVYIIYVLTTWAIIYHASNSSVKAVSY